MIKKIQQANKQTNKQTKHIPFLQSSHAESTDSR